MFIGDRLRAIIRLSREQGDSPTDYRKIARPFTNTNIRETKGGNFMSTETKTVKINDIDLPIKEYNGKRVVTFKDVDTVHKRPEGAARKRFSDNKKHFIEGVDYFKVKCSEVRPFFGQTLPNGFNPKADIALLTESGYLMLVKSFTDDLAWIVQRQLINTYFQATPKQRQEAAHQTMSDMEVLSRAFLIATNEVKSLKETVDGLNSKIEADAPAVAFANDVSLSKGAITIEKFAKSLCDAHKIKIGRNRLFKFLRDMKILQANNLPYQKYMDAG